MEPVITWILIADKHQARILEARGAGEGLLQNENQVFKAQAAQAYSDDEGRTLSRITGSRVRLDKSEHQEPEVIRFAKSIYDALLESRRKNKFHRLVICAGPSMLGLLRSEMPEELKNVLWRELESNLVNTPNDEIGKHLTGIVRV